MDHEVPHALTETQLKMMEAMGRLDAGEDPKAVAQRLGLTVDQLRRERPAYLRRQRRAQLLVTPDGDLTVHGTNKLRALTAWLKAHFDELKTQITKGNTDAL